MTVNLQNPKGPKGPLLDHLAEIEVRFASEDPTLKQIFTIFGPDGHYLIILFLILPFSQPIPLFGLSTIFGVFIAIVAAYSYIGKPPWLPARLLNRKIASKTVLKIAHGSEKVFEKAAFLLHPRWPVLFSEPFRSLSAFLIIGNALLLALPLPIPFSNAFPAWVIIFQTLGQLEDDGLFVILSYVQSALCAAYFVLLALGAGSGLERLGF